MHGWYAMDKEMVFTTRKFSSDKAQFASVVPFDYSGKSLANTIFDLH